MKLFMKSDERFESGLKEIQDIGKMLDKEGEQNGECRYKVFMAMQLLTISCGLRRISLALFCLIGFVIGKLLSGLL